MISPYYSQVNPIAQQVAEHGRSHPQFDYFDFLKASDVFTDYIQ